MAAPPATPGPSLTARQLVAAAASPSTRPPLPSGDALCCLAWELAEHVEALEHRLGELHCGDVNALRRAAASLQQHIQALEMEIAELRPPVERLSATLNDAVSVSKDAASLGVGLLAGGVAYRLVSREPKAPFWLRVAPLVLGAGVACARILLSQERRWKKQVETNKAAKAAALRWLVVCEERVGIMKALAANAPNAAPPAERAG